VNGEQKYEKKSTHGNDEKKNASVEGSVDVE
jgi:hypothetical protein